MELEQFVWFHTGMNKNALLLNSYEQKLSSYIWYQLKIFILFLMNVGDFDGVLKD